VRKPNDRADQKKHYDELGIFEYESSHGFAPIRSREQLPSLFVRSLQAEATPCNGAIQKIPGLGVGECEVRHLQILYFHAGYLGEGLKPLHVPPPSAPPNLAGLFSSSV
jgi:hypothetical protein